MTNKEDKKNFDFLKNLVYQYGPNREGIEPVIPSDIMEWISGLITDRNRYIASVKAADAYILRLRQAKYAAEPEVWRKAEAELNEYGSLYYAARSKAPVEEEFV